MSPELKLNDGVHFQSSDFVQHCEAHVFLVFMYRSPRLYTSAAVWRTSKSKLHGV